MYAGVAGGRGGGRATRVVARSAGGRGGPPLRPRSSRRPRAAGAEHRSAPQKGQLGRRPPGLRTLGIPCTGLAAGSKRSRQKRGQARFQRVWTGSLPKSLNFPFPMSKVGT